LLRSIKSLIRFLINLPNKVFKRKECYICHNKFHHFTKYKGGTKKLSEFVKLLNCIGSDPDNFGCICCGSHDRERHIFMFFDELKIWEKIKNAKILHFAPEMHLSKKIEKEQPEIYIKGDLFPKHENDVMQIDVTQIKYPENYFDFIICNHVLEHVPDYLRAMSEIFRVLKPGGSAILQTPYSKLIKHHFEEENINTDYLRNFFYAQEDHCRFFSETQFLNDLKKTGFSLNLKKSINFFNTELSNYYGINNNEDLIWVIKTAA
jgi:predicted SAM-dependent methyltransferase